MKLYLARDKLQKPYRKKNRVAFSVIFAAAFHGTILSSAKYVALGNVFGSSCRNLKLAGCCDASDTKTVLVSVSKRVNCTTKPSQG